MPVRVRQPAPVNSRGFSARNAAFSLLTSVSVFKPAFFQIQTGTAMISVPKGGKTTWQKTVPGERR